MCGFIAVIGSRDVRRSLGRALDSIAHRGPDARGEWHDDANGVGLGHARLSIIDLSDAGRQPMTSSDGRFTLVLNGEIYNYTELREQLADYPFISKTDTEVLLAAWARWGASCLDRVIGMFAFVIWDAVARELVCVRDRFGVKPMYVGHLDDGGMVVASEIKAVRAAGVRTSPDVATWADYLSRGYCDHSPRTFWSGIESVSPGTLFRIRTDGSTETIRWYDLAARVGDELDDRSDDTVKEEYRAVLENSVRLRVRSDVPIGICLSGGLDSSTLLGVVHSVLGSDSAVKAFTFVCGDEAYDELPWVKEMLAHTRHPLIVCSLSASEVPDTFAKIAVAEDEPFGGIPTLAYSRIFARAREEGVIVLLDGQGIDEQFAGYDYYRGAVGDAVPVLQGAHDRFVLPECLSPGMREIAKAPIPAPFPDRLRNLQFRDILFTKLPRVLRYNDRVSMAVSTELREPFLDHRLFELALRQPARRKIRGDVGKWMVRELTTELLPRRINLAPKRALQTPQREWLRGPLRSWANELIENAFAAVPDWFDLPAARIAWQQYQQGHGDNSFWVWQWLSLGFLIEPKHAPS